MSNQASGEDRLIERYFKPLARHPAAFGLIDDAAALSPPPGYDLVLKADAVIGGIHFFAEDAPGLVAQKALRVNLSDLAAKGAAPLGFLLSIGLPRTITEDWLADFSAGLASDIERYDCPLLGGDTVRSPDAIMVSVSVIGSLPHGTMVKRSGAQVGDHVVITGTVGDAALGLRLRQDATAADRWRLQGDQRDHLLRRYLLPEPRTAAADAVRAHAAGAMDVSDGLVGDLAKLCRAAGVSAQIDVARVPLSPAARTAVTVERALIETVLTGGDDYEVLATVPPGRLAAMQAAAHAAGVTLTDIGTIVAGTAPPQFTLHDQPLKFAQRSFSHF